MEPYVIRLVADQVNKVLSGTDLQVRISGAYRRSVRDLNEATLVLATSRVADAEDALMDAGWSDVASPIYTKEIRADGRNVPTYLALCSHAQYGSVMLHTTGSNDFVSMMRGHAERMRLVLNWDGLFDLNGSYVAGETEVDIFEALGLGYILPSQRDVQLGALLADKIIRVPSFGDCGAEYKLTVSQDGTPRSCTCKHFRYRLAKVGGECKHMKAYKGGRSHGS